MWTIVIAGSKQEALEAATTIVLDITDVGIVDLRGSMVTVEDSRGQRGRIECLGASTAIRALEGAQPDTIVIAGNYLDWNLPPGTISRLWWKIQHIDAMSRWGCKVRWA